MSATFQVGMALTELQLRALPTLDECLLDNATRGLTRSAFRNVENFAYGTGLWLVLIALAIGLFMAVFGNNVWIKRAGGGIAGLILLGAVVSVVTGAVGTGRC